MRAAAAARAARRLDHRRPPRSGSCVGLAILTPVFTADLQDAQVPAQEAITSLVLDAPLPPQDKIAVAQALADELSDQQGRVPDLHRPSRRSTSTPEARPAASELERDLDAQLERAATRAFRDSFLIGAGLALAALLVVIAPAPEARTVTGRLPAAGAAGARPGAGRRGARGPAGPRRRDVRAASARGPVRRRGRSRRRRPASTGSPSGSCCSGSTTRPAGWASAARR